MVFDVENTKLRDIYNRCHRLERKRQRFAASSTLDPISQHLILTFIDACASGQTGKRRSDEVRELRLIKLLSWLPRIAQWYGVPLNIIDEPAFTTLLQRIKNNEICRRDGKPYSQNTKLDIKKMIVQFWRWLSRHYDNQNYFKLADKHVRYSRYQPEPEAYTRERIWELSQNQALRFEFLLKIFFDGGFRPSEAWNLRRKDLKLNTDDPDDRYYQAAIRDCVSKTTGRTISLRLCTNIIDRYLRANPQLEDDDFLLQISTYTARAKLRSLAKYELGGKLTFTVLRHCSMTHYAPLINNPTALEYRYGEITGSKAIRHYIKKSGTLDQATAKAAKQGQLANLQQELQALQKENIALKEASTGNQRTLQELDTTNQALKNELSTLKSDLALLKAGMLGHLQTLTENGHIEEAATLAINQQLKPDLKKLQTKRQEQQEEATPQRRLTGTTTQWSE